MRSEGTLVSEAKVCRFDICSEVSAAWRHSYHGPLSPNPARSSTRSPHTTILVFNCYGSLTTRQEEPLSKHQETTMVVTVLILSSQLVTSQDVQHLFSSSVTPAQIPTSDNETAMFY